MNKFELLWIFVITVFVSRSISVFGEIVKGSFHGQRPHYKYSLSDVNGNNIDENSIIKQLYLNDKGYSSHILYVRKCPPSLSNEKYAKKIVTLQNDLELPPILRSEVPEIVEFLKHEKNGKREKRQYSEFNNEDQQGNVTITVTIYSKENDIIIIKEVIPEKNNAVITYQNGRTNGRTPFDTSGRQPNYVVGNWYATLRTIPVYNSARDGLGHAVYHETTRAPFRRQEENTDSRDYYSQAITSTSQTPYPSNWYDYSTEAAPPSSTSRPFIDSTWFLPRQFPQTTTTTTEPYYWDTTEEFTTTTTSRPLLWGFGWNDRTTTSPPTSTEPFTSNIPEETTVTSTTKAASWNWFFPVNPSLSETTTTTTSTTSSSIWDVWATNRSPSTTSTTEYNYWNDFYSSSTQPPPSTTITTTTTTTTTEKSQQETTTAAPFGLFNWFG